MRLDEKPDSRAKDAATTLAFAGAICALSPAQRAELLVIAKEKFSEPASKMIEPAPETRTSSHPKG